MRAAGPAQPDRADRAAPEEVPVPHRTGARPGLWRRVWQRLMLPADAELILGQLNQQLAVLEGARAELEAGWVQGGWWATSSGDGATKLATGYATAGGHPDHVDGVCLVGALVRSGSRRPGARSDVGRAVDAVYDALWASRGQPDVPLADTSSPDTSAPGAPAYRGLPPVPPPEVRLARVRTLTQWNDQAGRTRAEVLGVVDGAISATIMNLMSVPQATQAGSASASAGARAG